MHPVKTMQSFRSSWMLTIMLVVTFVASTSGYDDGKWLQTHIRTQSVIYYVVNFKSVNGLCVLLIVMATF